MKNELAYTINSFSEATGLGRSKIYVLIGTKALRAVKCGGRTLILAADARKFFNEMPEADLPLASDEDSPPC